METNLTTKDTEDAEDWAIAHGLDPLARSTRIAYAQALRAEHLNHLDSDR